mmetsp:Transcript_114966/g.310523  ORF Transcript_114966/g.310523 Transcript_114966/m.310523 type:complete len:236 (-) Transcript_114966:478-1185(-)
MMTGKLKAQHLITLLLPLLQLMQASCGWHHRPLIEFNFRSKLRTWSAKSSACRCAARASCRACANSSLKAAVAPSTAVNRALARSVAACGGNSGASNASGLGKRMSGKFANAAFKPSAFSIRFLSAARPDKSATSKAPTRPHLRSTPTAASTCAGEASRQWKSPQKRSANALAWLSSTSVRTLAMKTSMAKLGSKSRNSANQLIGTSSKNEAGVLRFAATKLRNKARPATSALSS